MNITFFGLGHMGGPMAANLIKAGHAVTVFDLQAGLVQSLESQGAIAASSPRDAVINAEVVISMLPSAGAVRSLYLGDHHSVESGILAHIPQGALIIDCSTIDAATAKTVSMAAQDSARRMIDAPVSGGVAGAAAATLTFICGGTQEDVGSAEPVLLCMGKKVFRAGDHGAGQTAKLCNNMLLAIH
ncbi:MAG: 3-hydroxyisobutyrate dehydrogenase, partial [Gammaproteobacteria bacterium HGW-Gammaproteobacteria-14]